MSDNYENYEVMFAVYGTEDGAAGAVESLKDMDKDKVIDIVDAATLVKDADGNTTVKQESLPSVKKGLGVGALIGGAIGLVFPPSILGAAAIGAGIGAGTAKLAKMALENDDLKEAADSLEPGSSAFIAVVENKWAEQLQGAIAGYDKLAEHAMGADAAGVINAVSTDDGAAIHGTAVAADGAAVGFDAVTDGTTVAGQVTAAAVDDDGNVAVDQVVKAATVDDAGNVGAVVQETAAVVDAEGNAAVAQATDAGVIPAEAAEDDASESSDDDAS
ncbi:MAG: DUF1269 domain-containing protein [Acidimicrobiia bacterium]